MLFFDVWCHVENSDTFALIFCSISWRSLLTFSCSAACFYFSSLSFGAVLGYAPSGVLEFNETLSYDLLDLRGKLGIDNCGLVGLVIRGGTVKIGGWAGGSFGVLGLLLIVGVLSAT